MRGLRWGCFGWCCPWVSRSFARLDDDDGGDDERLWTISGLPRRCCRSWQRDRCCCFSHFISRRKKRLKKRWGKFRILSSFLCPTTKTSLVRCNGCATLVKKVIQTDRAAARSFPFGRKERNSSRPRNHLKTCSLVVIFDSNQQYIEPLKGTMSI